MRELFLVSLGGIRYGVWKDKTLSLRNLDALHRIPLSPATIAGIMVEEGQTVTLADLPASIGYEHSTEIRQGSILLMGEGERVNGFVVSGEIDTQPIPPDLLFPLPDFLKTPVFDSCAVHDGIPIPIINVAVLYSRVMASGKDFSADSPLISAAQSMDISGKAGFTIFSAGGELFAVSSASPDSKPPANPGAVTPLPNMPEYVKGVTFQDGRLLPVIDLSQRFNSRNASPASLMLVAAIGGNAFGLLIDGDEGTLPADKIQVKPAPMIVQSPWLKHIVVRTDESIPLVDLAMALSPGEADEKPVWQRYTPDPWFMDHFFKYDVEVVEFSLLGERHALPKQEVEDVIAFKNCRALSGVPPIVIGVAEHNGEILPVVDLAMMFGRRSLTTPTWRMMLVSNGDFRALVITEAVFKARWLPVDIHRAVPIHLPHNLMYGCYPDAETVRLILNVEAISVHFEKTLIQQFLPALSEEMRMMSVEAETTGEVVSSAAPSKVEPEVLPVQESASGHQEAGEPVHELQQQAMEKYIGSIEVPDEVTAAPELSRKPELVDGELAAAPSAFVRQLLPSSGERGELEADGAIEQESVPSVEDMQKSVEEKGGSPLDRDAAVPVADVSQPPEPIPAAASTRPGIFYRIHQEEPTASAWKRRSVYGVLAVVLIAVLYVAGTSPKPDVEKSVEVTEQARIEQGKATVQKMAQNESTQPQIGPAEINAKLPRTAERLRAPLELDIPANMPPVDIDVYVVKEGDTLWSISQRFTGTPFNYPRIAGENRIADADLIFPGQRIRLNK